MFAAAVSRRGFLGGAAAIVSSAAGVGLYTRYIEPEWLEVVRRPMPIRHLPPPLEGKTLAHLSDIHVCPWVDDAYVRDTFLRVRALQPHIVVYTGDFTTLHPGVFAHAERVFSDMARGSLGTFASLGNHDYGEGWSHPEDAERMTSVLRNVGVTVLRNASAELDGLQVIGLGDWWGRDFFPERAFAALDARRPAVVLSHNPDTVDLGGWPTFDGWILSGHTHGGQCKAPFLPPPMLPVRNKRYTSGPFALSGQRQMYISRGVGTVLPVRFNVRPEVTVFTLTAA